MILSRLPVPPLAVLLLLLATGSSHAADAFVGEVRAFPFWGFAPTGWIACDGQLYSITEYPDLFQVLGTTYGGDGVGSFAVPDLRGRVVLGAGHGPGLSSRQLGEAGGRTTVVLGESEMPGHSHPTQPGIGPGQIPEDRFPLASSLEARAPGVLVPASGSGLGTNPSGGGQPHGNLQPCVVLDYYIATQGSFPTP